MKFSQGFQTIGKKNAKIPNYLNGGSAYPLCTTVLESAHHVKQI